MMHACDDDDDAYVMLVAIKYILSHAIFYKKK